MGLGTYVAARSKRTLKAAIAKEANMMAMRSISFRQCLFRIVASVFLILLGYLLAVVSFRQDEWIEYHSGARKTTCTLFPLSLSSDCGRSAFQALFDMDVDDDAEWRVLYSRYFIHPDTLLLREVSRITESEMVAGAHSRLVGYVLRHESDAQERRRLFGGFRHTLREHGVSAARRYVDELRMMDVMEWNPEQVCPDGDGKQRGHVPERD